MPITLLFFHKDSIDGEKSIHQTALVAQSFVCASRHSFTHPVQSNELFAWLFDLTCFLVPLTVMAYE